MGAWARECMDTWHGRAFAACPNATVSHTSTLVCPLRPQVSPWQADISGVVAAPTYNTTFSYRGLFKGANPNPEGEPGYILMTSFITFFGPRPPPSY